MEGGRRTAAAVITPGAGDPSRLMSRPIDRPLAACGICNWWRWRCLQFAVCVLRGLRGLRFAVRGLRFAVRGLRFAAFAVCGVCGLWLAVFGGVVVFAFAVCRLWRLRFAAFAVCGVCGCRRLRLAAVAWFSRLWFAVCGVCGWRHLRFAVCGGCVVCAFAVCLVCGVFSLRFSGFAVCGVSGLCG